MYDSWDTFVFLDNETYEQLEVQASTMEWEKKFLIPNLEVKVMMYQGETIGITLPDKVEMELVECEPAVAGNTATSATKNAKTETGLEIRVPLFIENGERVLISTADGKYSGRA